MPVRGPENHSFTLTRTGVTHRDTKALRGTDMPTNPEGRLCELYIRDRAKSLLLADCRDAIPFPLTIWSTGCVLGVFLYS